MSKDLHDKRRHKTAVTLWTLIAPPAIWAAHFLFCYLFAAIWCAKGVDLSINPIRLAIGAATIIALGLISWSGYIAWTQAIIEGDDPPHDESTWEDRFRFLAIATLMLAVLSFIATLYTALPALFLADCL